MGFPPLSTGIAPNVAGDLSHQFTLSFQGTEMG